MNVEQELEKKVQVQRDGSRGWRLSACFVEDALDLLNADEQKRAKYEVPSEDSEDYLETVTDMADTLERDLWDNGFTIVWYDGYIIYKDLSAEAKAALEEVGEI